MFTTTPKNCRYDLSRRSMHNLIVFALGAFWCSADAVTFRCDRRGGTHKGGSRRKAWRLQSLPPAKNGAVRFGCRPKHAASEWRGVPQPTWRTLGLPQQGARCSLRQASAQRAQHESGTDGAQSGRFRPCPP